jgi:hypothetical protein
MKIFKVYCFQLSNIFVGSSPVKQYNRPIAKYVKNTPAATQATLFSSTPPARQKPYDFPLVYCFQLQGIMHNKKDYKWR